MWEPQKDPLHPMNTMVFVEGNRQIPISVTAVIAFGFVLSALIVNTNPWKTSPLGAWDTPSKALSESSIGRPKLLLLFRLVIALHMSYISFSLWTYRGAVMLFFYTNWTFILETVYFILATGFSIQRLIQKPSGNVGNVGITAIALFHVVLVAALVVDILHWGVLWPILSKTKDPAILAHHTAMTFSWSSYNTNSIPYQPYLVGFTGFYTALYALWSFTIFVNTGRWVYPFLNTNKSWAFFVYAGILVGHLVFFGLATLLFRLKDRLVGTELSSDSALASLTKEADKKSE